MEEGVNQVMRRHATQQMLDVLVQSNVDQGKKKKTNTHALPSACYICAAYSKMTDLCTRPELSLNSAPGVRLRFLDFCPSAAQCEKQGAWKAQCIDSEMGMQQMHCFRFCHHALKLSIHLYVQNLSLALQVHPPGKLMFSFKYSGDRIKLDLQKEHFHVTNFNTISKKMTETEIFLLESDHQLSPGND